MHRKGLLADLRPDLSTYTHRRALLLFVSICPTRVPSYVAYCRRPIIETTPSIFKDSFFSRWVVTLSLGVSDFKGNQCILWFSMSVVRTSQLGIQFVPQHQSYCYISRLVFRPITNSDDRFACHNRYGPPSGFSQIQNLDEIGPNSSISTS